MRVEITEKTIIKNQIKIDIKYLIIGLPNQCAGFQKITLPDYKGSTPTNYVLSQNASPLATIQ